MREEELHTIHAQVAQALRGLDTTYKPPTAMPGPSPYGALHQAAAVLSAFDSESLRPTESPQSERIEDVLVNSTVVRSAHQSGYWALLPQVRQDVLRTLGSREALLHALAANPERPNDTVQQMLEAYIRGDAPPLDQQNRAQLAGTFQVAEWLNGVLDDLPALDAVRKRQESLSLLQPFEDLAGAHFRGRQSELQQLRDYVGVLPPGSVRERLSRIAAQIFNFQEKPPLVIHGPGGTGKSSLVARFIWEHATLPQTERFPWVYIDFDRPGLRAEEPLTLLLEGVRQLGLQYPEAREFCDRVRAQWHEQLRTRPAQQRTPTNRANSESPPIGSASSPQEWQLLLRSFTSLLNNLKLETDPLLLVLDTFEEVQYRSEIVVKSLCHFLEIFQTHVPRLRCVLAGRAPMQGVPGFPTKEIELGDFDPAAAEGFLEAHGVTPAELAKTIAKQVGGNPLSLNLALDVWRREGATATGIRQLQTRRLFGFRVRENEIQGQLFTRILSHIHDPDVRKLAYPGLILRRVTPDLIREVMAKPCGVEVKTTADAQRLFEEMQREGALVRFEDGALRHRADVRQLMLPLLRETEAVKIRQIEELAVAYYERQDGVVERAEEIYHRLSLQQPLSIVEARWKDGVQHYLFNALQELHVGERVWLVTHLKVPLSEGEREQAALADWERDTTRQGEELLARKQVSEALRLLRERRERTPGSVLYMLEARAWEHQENWAEARRVIGEGIVSASEAGNRTLAIELRLRGARIDLRLGDFPAAAEKLDETEMLLSERAGTPRWIETGLLRLALYRAQKRKPEDLAPVKQQLRDHFDHFSDSEAAQHPALLAWLAAELGAEQTDVLRRVIRLIGVETSRQGMLRQLGQALARWDSQVSKQEKAPPGVLARQANIPETAKSLTDDWTQAVLRIGGTALTRLIERLLESFPNPFSGVLTALVDIVRERAGDLVPVRDESISEVSRKSSHSRQVSLSSSVQASSRLTVEMTAEYTEAGLQRLSPRQRQQFGEALLDAFDRAALAEMVQYRLDRSLDSLVLADDLQATVFTLVDIAEREGWTAQLLAAARESRPDNAKLLTFAEQFGLASITLSDQQLEHLLKTPTTFIGATEWRMRLGRLETQVCRVEVGGPSPIVFGTGFLVGPDLLLTNYNVLEEVIHGKLNPRNVAFRFDYKSLADGTALNLGTVFRLAEEGWLIDYSPYSEADSLNETATLPLSDELDYALVRVAGAPGLQPIGGERAELSATRRGWIAIPTDPVAAEPNTPLLILHHAEAGQLQVSIEPDGVLGLNSNRTRIKYKAETAPGSSGAPCFNSNWDLIALHHSRPGPECEGIPISAIVGLLEERGKKDLLSVALP